MTDALLTAQRWAVLAVVVVAGLLFSRATFDAFNLPRFTVVLILALVLLVLVGWRAVVERVVTVPERGPALVAGAFLIATWVTTIIAGVGASALLGPYARYNGALSYTAYVVLFLVTVTAFTPRTAAWVLVTVGCAVAGAVLYGLLQVAGADPIGWIIAEPIFSTVGQLNFAAGLTAIGVPVALWAAVSDERPTWFRVAGAAMLLAAVFYVAETSSFQGVVAAAAGCIVVIAALAIERGWLRRPSRRVGIVGAGACVVVAATLLVTWSRIAENLDEGFFERRLLWRAGLRMWQDNPLTGIGFGGYANEFSRYRPDEHAIHYGLDTADAAHNVPVDLLVTGGVLLLVAYLAVVILTGRALFLGLRDRSGAQRMVVAGLGGAWVAYHVQSLVSIDVPALAALHWVLAAAVIVASAAEPSPEMVIGAGRRRARRGRGARAPLPATAYALVGGMVVVALVGVWFAMTPLRADVAAWQATEAIRAGDQLGAVEDLERAVDLAPWEGTYWGALATMLQQVGQPEEAVDAGARAAQESPGAAEFAVNAAKLAASVGRTELADRLFAEAVERAPNSPQTLAAAATHFGARGEHERALDLIEEGRRLQPAELQFDLLLGEELLRGGNEAEARATFEDIIRRAPGSNQAEVARARLAEIG